MRTNTIKIAASILEEHTELIAVPKKIKVERSVNVEDFDFLNDKTKDIEDINNIFFSILDKYQTNSFDLFNLKDISETLNIDIDIENKKYNIDLLLYRIATNLNVPLLIDKNNTEIKSNLKLSLSDLENKFNYLIEDIEEINKKIDKIEEIKKEIKKENDIINNYIIESDNLSMEKLKNNIMEEKIHNTKKSIYEKVTNINRYINYKLKG